MKIPGILITGILVLLLGAAIEADGVSTRMQTDLGSATNSRHQQRFQSRSTAAVPEPAGYTAACFATNLDTTAHVLNARIFDWRGNNVTETGSCGVAQGAGITCQSTATYTDSALRCVVSTDGDLSDLRGSLSVSDSAYPFTNAAFSTVTAE
jgi:hypothetical protein